MPVTHHALKLCQERFGWSQSVALDKAWCAYLDGHTHTDFGGHFRNYLNEELAKTPKDIELRVYQGKVFVFAQTVLITVWFVPKDFIGYLPARDANEIWV